MDFQETNGIQTGSGIKLVIYGQEGVGKSSLAAQLPGAVFLDCEGSTSKMNVRRLPKPTSWETATSTTWIPSTGQNALPLHSCAANTT